MISFIQKYWQYILIVILIPIAINYVLLSWRVPGLSGSESDWMGFISNYLGGVIGGIVALSVARQQIKNERQARRKEHRTYISAATTVINFDNDDKIGRKEDIKLILTDSYTNLVASNSETLYYSVLRYGGSDIVTNCHFEITVGSDMEFENKDTIEVWVDYFEKNEELLIPLCSRKLKELNPLVKEIKATFFTTNNDKIEFQQSEVDKNRTHIFHDSDTTETMQFETKETAWSKKAK